MVQEGFILLGADVVLKDVCGFLQLPVQQAGVLGVSSCNADGFTPLHVAALHGHSSVAALLIRHGANVNARTNQNATPLHLASQNSHVQVEEQLLSLGMKQLIGIILINQLLKLSPSKSRLIINWSVEALRRAFS